MKQIDADFTARVTHIAQRAKAEGFEDVAAWMTRHLISDKREPMRSANQRAANQRKLRRLLDLGK